MVTFTELRVLVRAGRPIAKNLLPVFLSHVGCDCEAVQSAILTTTWLLVVVIKFSAALDLQGSKSPVSY